MNGRERRRVGVGVGHILCLPAKGLYWRFSFDLYIVEPEERYVEETGFDTFLVVGTSQTSRFLARGMYIRKFFFKQRMFLGLNN